MSVNRFVNIVAALFGCFIIYTMFNRLCIHGIVITCTPDLIKDAENYANQSAE